MAVREWQTSILWMMFLLFIVPDIHIVKRGRLVLLDGFITATIALPVNKNYSKFLKDFVTPDHII